MNKTFDENNVIFTFSAMSDVHISGSWYKGVSRQKLINGLSFARETASNPVDAYVFAGDFTDCMNSKANVLLGEKWGDDFDKAKAEQSAAEFETLREAFNEHIPEEAEIIYCLGNHDSVNRNNIDRFIKEFSSRDTIGDNKNFDRMYRTDLDLESMKQGMRHCVCKGYHFLCIDIEHEEEGYQKTLEFLKKNLDEITAKEPLKYVFVIYHYKVPHTNFASDTENPTCARKIGEFLKNYPQVVLLTGHTHTSIAHERAIHQKYYTNVEGSCVSYVSPNWVFKDLNETHAMHYDVSEGLLFEVDKNGAVRITRLDYINRKTIKEPWELPAPKADGSHLLPYNEDKKYRVKAPEFAEGADFSIKETEDGNIEITIPKAAINNNDVYRYQLVCHDTNARVSVHYISSLFCYFTDKRLEDDTLTAVVPVSFEYIYKISLTAQDFWLNESKPIVKFFK